MSSEEPDMGALFQKRRAQAAASKRDPNSRTQQQQQPSKATSKSLLDIQEEQEREQQQRGGSSHGGYGGNRGGHSGGAYGNFSRRGNSPKRDGGSGRISSGGGGTRGGGRRGRSGGANRSNLPLEQGVICTLKESFGFIHCADRPEEIFFHYSEISGIHPDDLQMDDEVEFRIGSSSSRSGEPEKLAAYQVRRLEPGTIVWETADGEPGQRYRGLVERPVRPDRRGTSSSDTEGTIRVLMEKDDQGDDEGNVEEVTDTADGPVVRFTANDYTPAADDGSSPRGPPRRASNRLARGDLVEFSIVTERRTKSKVARSITLLLSEKERARQQEEKRMLESATEEHGVVTALKGEYGFLRSNKRREEVYFHYSSIELEGGEGNGEDDGDFVLKEGQDMKFLVVGDGANQKISARRVSLQPRGSVLFHKTLATGVTGVVSICPQPIDSGHSLDQRGKIRLTNPLTIMDEEDGSERVVTEVLLRSKSSPGGTFGFRGGALVGLWIQPGDTLLFDVAKDFVDGTCHAIPTKYVTPRNDEVESDASVDGYDDDDDDIVPAVRLIDLSLAGRAEGIVNTVKESVKEPYGFLHYAERPVDVHFKLFQVLPDELQMDLRRNMGLADVDSNGEPLKLKVGVEAQFDLSIHGTIQAGGASRNRKGERENMKAQRILFLPPKTIVKNKVLASNVQGTVSKDDPRQAYSGTVELDEAVMPMSMEERHPLVAKMIDSYLASDVETPLVFHDVQSTKEDKIVIDMLESKGKGKLSWTHIPQAGFEAEYAGRLCIRKVDPEPGTVGPEPGAVAPEPGTVDPEPESTDAENVLRGDSDEPTASEDADKAIGASAKKRKKQLKALKPVKTLRFDKSSLSSKLKEDIPPTAGCIVRFDVVQSRRTGQLSIEYMTMVERRAVEVSLTDVSGMGIVKEVVTARNFGFISVLDDDASKREMLFFNLSNVVDEASDPGTAPKVGVIRKGDEVKFDVGTESNGKRVAMNVTVLPNGTIPSKADKNACRGYILLEPAHTTLKNTPSRAQSNISQRSEKSCESSRWESVSDAPKNTKTEVIREEGCILLLEDPTNMFGRDEGDASHLHYKNGAIAIHGTGSSTAVDGSTNPRRGDLVTFAKAKNGAGVRDIRLVQRAAATLVRGTLDDIVPGEDGSAGSAKFLAATESQDVYQVDLSEVVSCDPSRLKEKEAVEGIFHDGQIHGVCRTSDVYLGSKLGSGHKERPKLNLTVKKDRGGTIMAQSMMAKGPDGTNGFTPGWTKRVSKYAPTSEEDGKERQDNSVEAEAAVLGTEVETLPVAEEE